METIIDVLTCSLKTKKAEFTCLELKLTKRITCSIIVIQDSMGLLQFLPTLLGI